jgi:hypothetical protein
VTGARNVRGGLVLLALGLLGGLAMSLYAFQPVVKPLEGLAAYDDLPRRLLRLGHIAAVMLPLINLVLAPWIDRVALHPRARQAASWLLLLGAAGLPAALAVEAAWAPARSLHLAGPPAAAFTAGVVLMAIGAMRGLRVEAPPAKKIAATSPWKEAPAGEPVGMRR